MGIVWTVDTCRDIRAETYIVRMYISSALLNRFPVNGSYFVFLVAETNVKFEAKIRIMRTRGMWLKIVKFGKQLHIFWVWNKSYIPKKIMFPTN